MGGGREEAKDTRFKWSVNITGGNSMIYDLLRETKTWKDDWLDSRDLLDPDIGDDRAWGQIQVRSLDELGLLLAQLLDEEGEPRKEIEKLDLWASGEDDAMHAEIGLSSRCHNGEWIVGNLRLRLVDETRLRRAAVDARDALVAALSKEEK